MPALKYSYDYNQQVLKPAKQTPVQEQTPLKVNVIKDDSKSKIAKLNKILGASLGIAVIFSMLSYSVVVAQEYKISALHSNIMELNYENIELENKLEQIKSYYSVNQKVAQTKALDKAQSVLEVSQKGSDVEFSPSKQKLKVKSVLGY